MKRSIVVGLITLPLAVVLCVAVAQAEKGRRGGHGGPPPCTDPIPAARQAKMLKAFGDKGIDADKDGTLTCAEVKAFFDANPQLKPHREGQKEGPKECTDPIPADKQAKMLKAFGDKGIDADKDGKLTCAEVKAFFDANPQLRRHREGPKECTDPIPADKQAKLLKEFGDKGIDADKDGKLTCDEVKAYFAAKEGGKKGACPATAAKAGAACAKAANAQAKSCTSAGKGKPAAPPAKSK